jgi:hypothetical protein
MRVIDVYDLFIDNFVNDGAKKSFSDTKKETFKKEKEQLTSTGYALVCGGILIAEWRGEEIVLPKIDSPTKKMTTHRNRVVISAGHRGIRVIEER